MSTNAFGIDLGTSNIKIYSAADDHIMIEKNMIAIQNKRIFLPMGIPPMKCMRRRREIFRFPIPSATA